MTRLDKLKQQAKHLKAELYALYLAYRDPRVPWYAKIFIACVVGYAFSPIDLIPDPIPLLGYLDDLILVPLGIALAIKMIPADVMAEYRERARSLQRQKPTNWLAAAVIVSIWLLFAMLAVFFAMRATRR
ncbi:YkvA family protein [Chroococcidiopsis sp. CCNUC1]|uniref:YkvA family protein n=1 Tax=Chroococcidiopsis sp. CCNUC1 TaxID=2653189 RepID=UPI0020210D17|nr:YkvA family protein [Chroococcidiopsis sp. CCNUC1]URD53394.1 YkvA family protein [Chroococcidiopsis sp. CCNUC1]